MTELVSAPPWPGGPIVVALDAVDDVTLDDLEALEHREAVAIGAVTRPCAGAALAVAMAVDLLVAAPSATFGRAGAWADPVIRRATGIAGRHVAGYLAVGGRTIAAQQARMWGIVTRVADDPVAVALELAAGIDARSPQAVATILRQAHRDAATDYDDSRAAGRC